jgi:myosin heavy subunit
MADAVLHLLGLLKVGKDDYRMGKTKIFIKEPATVCPD